MKRNKIFLVIVLTLLLSGCRLSGYKEVIVEHIDEVIDTIGINEVPIEPEGNSSGAVFDYFSIPEYHDKAYVTVNSNIPYFTEDDMITESFEKYSELDSLGRCGIAFANICMELLPTEERGEIGQIKPSGWQTVKYSGLVDGNYLYNRCHLIAYCLAGENANEKNLITGTRYLNIEGMLPFEEKVVRYVEKTGNHVLYRVTPVFVEDELVVRGVLLEAYSVEDEGKGICFNVFCYNVQPGIGIDYGTGESRLVETVVPNVTKEAEPSEITYVLNKSSKKIHRPNCSSIADMKEKNKELTSKTKEQLLQEGYSECQRCNP